MKNGASVKKGNYDTPSLSTRRGVGRDTYSLPKKTRLRRKWHVNG